MGRFRHFRALRQAQDERAGLLRQAAGANIRTADGQKGTRQELRVIHACKAMKCKSRWVWKFVGMDSMPARG